MRFRFFIFGIFNQANQLHYSIRKLNCLPDTPTEYINGHRFRTMAVVVLFYGLRLFQVEKFYSLVGSGRQSVGIFTAGLSEEGLATAAALDELGGFAHRL